MTAKRTTKEAPAKAGAKRSAASAKLAQDREHFRGYMRAYEAFKDAMATDEYDPALEAFERAMERVSREMPDEARAIEDAFAATNEMWDRATAALIDANYHECERRAIAPELTRSKDKSRQGKVRWKDDPSQKAKREAEELWPTANRLGWTAVRLHTELVSLGFVASPGRVAKWMTNLRKTGRC